MQPAIRPNAAIVCPLLRGDARGGAMGLRVSLSRTPPPNMAVSVHTSQNLARRTELPYYCQPEPYGYGHIRKAVRCWGRGSGGEEEGFYLTPQGPFNAPRGVPKMQWAQTLE